MRESRRRGNGLNEGRELVRERERLMCKGKRDKSIQQVRAMQSG